MNPKSKYNRKLIGVNGIETITDAYRVLVAFNVIEPENQHAIKKQLCLGSRGKASYMQDLDEAILSLEKLRERKNQEEKIEPEKKVSKHPKCKVDGCDNRGTQKGCLCKKHNHVNFMADAIKCQKEYNELFSEISELEHAKRCIEWGKRNLDIALCKNIK